MTAFGEAFKSARAAGKTTFKWNGRLYHTKTKDEMEQTKKSVPTPTPRPATNSGPRSSSVDDENVGRRTQQTAPSSQPEDMKPAKSLAIAPAKADTEDAPQKPTRSHGKSSFLATYKGNPPAWPTSKPRRIRGGANKSQR